MKQITNRFSLPVAALFVLGALAGCTKSDQEPNTTGPTLIAPLAALGESGVEAGSTASNTPALHTKAPVSGSDALELYFARADETVSGTYGDYDATALIASRASGTGEQPLIFNPLQYYRSDGLKTKLTGWYPGGATAAGDVSGKGFYDGAARTVSWTIDGQQDLMTAAVRQGDKVTLIPAITFEHRLSQLQFFPYAEHQATIDAWGKITKIEVLNQQNKALYTLTDDVTGALSFSGSAANKFSAGIAPEGAPLSLSTVANKETDAKQVGNPVMIAPQDTGNTLILRITTANKKYKDVTLTQPLRAGTPYRLYMCFKEFDINITATVAEWRDVTITDKPGEWHIGDFMDGGIVYSVDEPNKKYMVLSLEQGSSLKWSALATYVLGSNGQSTTNGRENVAAMKRYATANSLNFADAFPAAYFCDKKNTGDVRGWYFPARDELVSLWTAHSWNETAIETGLTKNGGVAFPASGTPFWSSTEDVSSPNAAPVLMWNALHSPPYIPLPKDGGYYVRCVKTIEPPAIGDYMDGGIIYSIDKPNNKYKVLSLDEGSNLQWAMGNYELGPDGQNRTNGKANVAAMKAYATTNGLAFADAFPAAYFCDKKNTGGVTDWYLPAMDEMLGFIFASTALNTGLTNNGGTAITSPYIWSSTEENARNAWWGSSSNYKDLGYFVRCVRVL